METMTFGAFVKRFLANKKVNENDLIENLLSEIKTGIIHAATECGDNYCSFPYFFFCKNDQIIADFSTNEFTDLGKELVHRCWEEDMRLQWVTNGKDYRFVVSLEN